MIVRNEIVLVRQLTLYPLGVCNMFQIRHLPLTLSMFLVLMMIMIVLLTFNCYTAPIGPPNQSYEMVILILFLFIAIWGIYLLTLRVSRSLWFVWPNTLRIRKLIHPNSTTLRNLKVLVKLPGDSFLLSTIQNRILFLLTITIILLDKKYYSNTLWKPTLSKVVRKGKKKPTN